MPTITAPQTRIDAYLAEFRTHLRSLPHEQMLDIVEEIRSHLRDTAEASGPMTEASLNAALHRLGPASALAASYLTENLLARAERSRSPWLLLKSSFRWASLSVQGFLVFFGALIGYSLAAAFSYCALAKPLNPRNVGLWKVGDDNFSLHLGLSHSLAPPVGQEVLGMWIIPLGLIAAMILVLLTTEIGLRTIRRFQRARLHFAH
jgi:hypothetical protein